jgi:biopolymer transport protein ExbD
MAGSAPRAEEGKKKARIEIIPLIDVIFFLLATFVLFTLSLDKLVSVPVQLPVANDAPSKPDPDMVTLQMSDEGTCYWNRELIDVSAIGPRLEDYRKRVTNPRVLVTGDTKTKWNATVLALDEVRKAGITQVSVETAYPLRPTGK